MTAIVRATVEHPTSEQSVPKPTLYAERQVRMVQIRQQLGGVILEGHNEPAYSLVDECCFQYETRCLRYVEPAKCASREAEVTSGKLNKKLHLDGSSLTVKESKNIPDESVNNAYQLMLCFRRRAVAYEFSGLISYRSHERYTDSLMRHLQQDPPPNFHSTSITQVLRADKEVFSYLSKHCDNIRPDAAGVKPLDNMLMEALRDYHVAFHLMPLPQSASAQQRREPSDTKTSPSAPYPARPQKEKARANRKTDLDLRWHPEVFLDAWAKTTKEGHFASTSTSKDASMLRLAAFAKTEDTIAFWQIVSSLMPGEMPTDRTSQPLQLSDSQKHLGMAICVFLRLSFSRCFAVQQEFRPHSNEEAW